MFAELITAASSVRATGELVALIHKTKVSEAVLEKSVELNTLILSLQENCALLRSQHEELKTERDALAKKIVEIEDWNAKAKNYSLTEVSPGVFAYTSKPGEQTTTPVHWLCANCFHERKSFLLQKVHSDHRGDQYRCFKCQAELMVSAYDY